MYEKQNFKNGDILDAAQLEAMEDGIIEAQSSSGGTKLYKHELLLNYEGEVEGETPYPLYIVSPNANEVRNIGDFSGLEAISLYDSWYLPGFGPLLPIRKLYEVMFCYNLDGGGFVTVNVTDVISDTVTPL